MAYGHRDTDSAFFKIKVAVLGKARRIFKILSKLTLWVISWKIANKGFYCILY